MITRIVLGWTVVVLLSLGAAPSAGAAEDEDGWECAVAAWHLWLPEEHAHICIGAVGVPVDGAFEDVFDLVGKRTLLLLGHHSILESPGRFRRAVAEVAVHGEAI